MHTRLLAAFALPVAALAAPAAAETVYIKADRLLEVDGRATRTWTEAGIALATAVIDREPTAVRVRTAEGDERVRLLPLDRPGLQLSEERPFTDLGLRPAWPAVVGEVSPGSAADAAGLRAGDRIVALDGRPVHTYDQVSPLLQELAGPDRALALQIERDGRRQVLEVRPQRAERDGQAVWQLGVLAAPLEQDALLRFGPLAAVPAALAETRQMTSDVRARTRPGVAGSGTHATSAKASVQMPPSPTVSVGTTPSRLAATIISTPGSAWASTSTRASGASPRRRRVSRATSESALIPTTTPPISLLWITPSATTLRTTG